MGAPSACQGPLRPRVPLRRRLPDSATGPEDASRPAQKLATVGTNITPVPVGLDANGLER